MKTVLLLVRNIIPLYDSGLTQQIKTLESEGYDVILLSLSYDRGLNILQMHRNKIKKWQEINNISYIQSYFRQKISKYKILNALREYLFRYMEYKAILSMINKDIDIIHAQNFDTMLLALKLKKYFKCKVIYHMKEYYAKMDAQNFKSIKLNWYLWLDKYVCKRADWIFVVTDDQYNKIDNFINGDGKF